jgi:RNA polymerase sigma factor (sigma-70 family)
MSLPKEPVESTQSLARGARGGRSEDLGALYARLLPSLYAWARLRIRPEFRSALPPEDLVQEVWLRAAQAFGSFDAERVAFRPWLFAVAKNVLFEAQRRVYRRAREREEASGRLPLASVPDDVTSLTQRVQRDEGVRIFLEHVSRLDDDDRRLLIHCGLEELPLREAADRLALSRDALAKRWQRLRDRMRAWRLPEGLVAG